MVPKHTRSRASSLAGVQRSRLLARLAAIFVLVSGAGFYHGCGSRAADSVTETGNPPFLDQSKLQVEARDGQIIVTAAPDAVPGHAEVRLSNDTNGDERSSTAESDGSFVLQVSGQPEDEVSLSVDSGAETESYVLAAATSGEQDANPEPTQSTCDELYDSAQSRLDAALETASTACEEDADCAVIPGGPACSVSCVAVALSQEGTTSVEQVRGSIEEQECAQMEAAQCSFTVQPIGCDPIDRFPNGVGCIDGECAAKPLDVNGPEEGSPGPAPDSAQLCAELSAEMDQLEQALADADRTCSVDEDCVVARANSACSASCAEESISVTGAAELDDLRVQLETEVCSAFGAAQCPPKSPPCATLDRFPNGPGCVAGLCAAKPDGVVCGGLAGDPCSETEYCAYEPGQACGELDASAVCRPRPDACDAILAPVCGCDGVEYTSDCEAARAGTGVANTGACEDDAG